MQNDITAEEALHAEDLRYAAQMSRDFSALERLYDDGLVYFHSSGAIDTKASFIGRLRDGPVRFHRMTRHDANVRTYGPIAIITGRGTYDVTNTKGEDATLEQLFHAVWVKGPDDLKFVSWQATRLPPKS